MNMKDCIDAVTAVINGLAPATIPAHKTFKYIRPLSLSGPSGAAYVPALSVASASISPTEEDTEADYQYKNHLMITWFSGQMSAMGSGAADEALGAACLDQVEAIVNSLSTVAIAGLSFEHDVTIGAIHFGPIHGGIYASEINLTITAWEL